MIHVRVECDLSGESINIEVPDPSPDMAAEIKGRIPPEWLMSTHTRDIKNPSRAMEIAENQQLRRRQIDLILQQSKVGGQELTPVQAEEAVSTTFGPIPDPEAPEFVEATVVTHYAPGYAAEMLSKCNAPAMRTDDDG